MVLSHFVIRVMAATNVSPRAVIGSGEALIDDLVDANFEGALIREQYRSLARLAPYFYGQAIIAAAALCTIVSSAWPTLLIAAVPAALLPAAALRTAHWMRARRRVDRLSLVTMRREVRAAQVVGPALSLALSLFAAVALPRLAMPEQWLLIFVAWIAMAVGAVCLSKLGHTAAFVVFGVSAPLIAALLRSGDGSTIWLAAFLLFASCFMLLMMGEFRRTFVDVVRSSVRIAEGRRAAEDERNAATAIAHIDDLTGLPNRRWLLAFLAARVQARRSGDPPFAVALLDLDGFKPINDVHGHPVGDEALKEVASRLASFIRERGQAARMGGDEFAIVCENVATRDQASEAGEELLSIFDASFLLAGATIHLSGAVGFALCPASGDRADELIRAADTALYRAKSVGRGRVSVFDKTDASAIAARAELEEALRPAVLDGRIGVAFRPTVDLTTGRLSGFEALPVWTDARLGSIDRSVFLPLAESIGIFASLSIACLGQAARAASRWPSPICLSFNFSTGALCKPGFGAEILSAIRNQGLACSRLEIEVSEGAVAGDSEAARATVDRLRAAGVRMTLDHFGAGQSSLAEVRNLALDKIKIDRSIVEPACRDIKSLSLLEAIVDMARRMGLPCAADGIATVQQLDALRRSGCAEGQGPLFGDAMSEASALRCLENERCAA
jgi:diguanylate cyclase (GGDEF)-like protein